MAKSISSSTAKALQLEYARKMGLLKESVKQEETPAKPRSFNISDRIGLLSGNDKSFSIYIQNINKAPAMNFDLVNQKEIVSQLLSHYHEVLNEIIKPEYKRNYKEILSYLKRNHCDQGVCNAARIVLAVNICTEDWVLSNYGEGPLGFWYDTPHDIVRELYLGPIDEEIISNRIIKCISWRVEKLQEILNSME